MAEMTRNPDFLRITASTARRVRNLETGVHPTSAETAYYDSYGPIAIDITHPYMEHSASNPWRWFRRIGVVGMKGGIDHGPVPHTLAEWGTTEEIGVLPVEARPLVEITAIIPMHSISPFYARMTVGTDGTVTIHRDGTWTDPYFGGNGHPWFTFEGPTWTVN